ncbi:Titin [Phytophthora ramorum]|uniref:Titin n=2 Tax=Phytophthora ramorum TaxID=164328 RepID=UPI0030B0041B|nr:Titin [Phytophthora ramorum]
MSWTLLFGLLLLLVTVVGAAFFTPEDVPGPPEKILVSPASDSSMRVQFSPPLNVKPEGVNGAPVLGYKVDVARRVDEVQTFSVAANGPILAGAYKLQFGAQMTPCIPWNASDVELEMALEELPTVDSVGVSRSAYSAAKNGYVYTITFDGAYLGNGKQTDTLDGDTTGCPGTQPPNRVLSFEGLRVATGVPGYYPEVWEVVSTNTGTQVLGGTFDLSVGFEGDWVATHPAITATVAAGSRTAKASMLGVVNRGDRVRIGGEEFTVHTTAPFTDSELPLDSYHVRGASAVVVEIMDTALGNVQVTKTSNDVATSSDFSSKLAARQQVRIGTQDVEVASITANTITLVNAWTGASTLHVTAYARKKATLSANAEAADMKRALGALPGVGTIDVSRVGPTKSNGYRWYVTFESLDSGNCPTSPCFRVDKKTGTSNFVDVYGAACTTCTVTASIVEDESRRMTLNAIKGDFAATAIVASREVGGVVAEVQSISTEATTDDISGSFAVSFQAVGGAVINFDDTAVDVRTKLQSLATVGRLNVTRVDNSEFGATWTITFLSNLGDLPLLVVDDETMLRGTGVSVVVQELVKGVDVAFETIIDGLVPGQEYFVRAYARNENGYGTSTTELQQRGRGALPLLASVATSPEAPGITGMWPLSGSQMELRLSSPVDHGDPVSKYLFEYVVGDTFGKPAIKKLYIYNSLENDIAGTFRLQYGDDVSSKLSVHSTASTLESALNSLPSLRPVSVTRALCVLTGQEDISFSTNNNRLTTTTPLTASQCKLLLKSVRIDVGGHIFTVRVQPAEGSSYIDVELSHVKPDFTEKWAVLKLDGSGSELGPYGYAWTISFDNVAEDVVDSKYPGLQLVSSLTSVKTGSAAEVTHGIDADQHAAPAQHYGYFEINNDERVCDTYVVGAPSSVQVVRLFGPTTATGGTFTLKLGIETTDCISLGKTGTASTIQSKLIALDVVDKVTVEEVRAFKVILLAGSATSKVTDYDNTGMLTVASALTQNQVDVLPKDTIIQVSRNPNDFSRHSCEFTVTTPPALGTTKISVSPAGSCDFFTGEARSLKILDFHDYNVRFWGHYPTGEWPTLQFDSASFGAAPCDPWVPSLTNLPVYGQVHTVKYEGSCSKGQAGIQTILADASSIIGGTFTLSYLGEVTSPLSFKNTGAAEMRDAIDSITVPGTVNVSVSQYGAYGKAWHVTFAQEETGQDSIFIQHARLTGQNALISVYPTVTVFTDAKQDDISGSFRIWFGGETTEAIGFSATHMKVTQELQKLSAVDSVLALGDKTAGDIGVYSLELTADAVGSNQVLSNIRLGGVTIDPTRFLAIGETLVVDTDIGGPRTIQSMTPLDITLTTAFAGTTAQNLAVLAGLITKQIKPLPGYVSITRLAQVVAVSKDSKTFELPRDHGFSVNGVFFVGGSKFKVITVAGAIVTTDVAYAGDSVVSANPKVYLFDNKLQTTEDLTSLVTVGDELWLPSVSADMSKYTIDAKDPRYLTVKSGSFSDRIVRTRAYHISNGRKWNLVFRSYDGSLDTIDAIPEHDWRGTEARIGTRSPNAAFPNVVNVGNPVATQTILLEVIDASAATTYSLSFASEARAGIPWSTLNGDLKTELEKLDSVDGVSVTSIMRSGTVIHTISFWGSYPMKKIPLLVATPASDNLKVYVRGNDAVAVTKQNNLILESSQTYAFRIFAENAKGISDSVSVFQVQTSTSSVVPTPPTGVALGEFHGSTWLSINYWAPFYSGGARVTMYRIEWDSSPNFDSSSIDYGAASIQEKKEVQHVTTSYRSSVGVGGTFTLSWGGHTTAALPFDCNVADMTDALAIITDTTNVAVDPVKVTRARVSWGYAWKITFSHNPGDLAPLVADGTQLTGDFPRISVVEAVQGFCDLAIGDFTHEVQEVFTDGVSVVDGAFTLTFGDKTTGTISVSASALEMQAALQAITTLYSIKVTKAIRNKDINTAIWSVTFAYLRGEEMVGAGNIFTMTVADSQLSGTSAVVRVANKVTGSDPFRFYLTDLRPGVKYYAHVMAYNADGFGSATSPLSTAVTCGQPQPPQSVIASVVDGTTLALDWSASTVDGDACRLDKYKVEWFRAEGTLEQQIITTSAGKGLPEIQRLVDFADSRTLSGYFKLSFGREATENLQWDAAAVGLNSVKERLERLSTIGTVDVSRLESTRVSTLFVTATGKIVMRHPTLSTSTMDETNLAKDDKIWIAGNQRTITATPTATTITIDTDLEVTIPVPVFKSAYGYEWKITFLAGHVGPQELIQVYPSDSWTGNNPGIFVDSIQKGLQPISGTFRVAFASGGVSDTTRPLPHNISAIDLQTALESLVTIGGVNVTKTTNGYGYNWVITFLSEFKNDVSLLSVDGTELQGPATSVKAEWINPLFDGGASLKFYQIEWDEQDDFSSGHSSSATISIVQPVAPIPANSYVIPNLLAGSNYYVHVAALTDIGIGAFTPSASIEPSGSALAVQNIDAGYALYEREVQEIRLAASHITEIQEITTEAASIPEVQTLQTYASPELCPTGACITGSFAFRVPTVQTVTISADAAITGTFTLLFEREVSDNAGAFTKIGAVTAAINWDADAGTVKDKLTTVANSALAATDIVVTRDGDASPEFGYGYVFQVTFIGNSVAGETLSMTCTPSFTTVGNVASRCSVAMNTNMAMGTDTMVQEVIVTAEKPLVVGSYKLGFDHLGLEKDTACIPFDASAGDMKTKLEELSNIDHVFVTREAYADKAAIGFVYRIFFHGNGVRTAVNKLEGKSTGCSNFQTQENNVLTEVGVVGTVETSIVDKGGFDAGNTFVAAAANAVTSTAAQLSTDLNRLPIFGNVLVTRSLVDDQGGCIWTVAFEESEGNLPQFICAVDANFKAGTVCKTDTLTDGNVLSGSFFIGASSPIPFNADAAQIENELEAMGNINTVQVKRSAPSPQFGYTWTVTFVDYDGDAPPLLVTSSLVGTGSRISVREVRKGNALSGTFTLSYLTAVTAPIKWNALETAAKSTSDGSSLQEKLEALDVVGRVSVQRSGPGHEGGYSWLVTFLDNVLNSGDLPLLQGNASMLTGEGAVVFTREVTKGSNAVGDQLWLSFDPPASDNGSPITKYQVRWDTSSKFTANPAEVFITDADVLYRTQRITTSAPSLAWSSNMIQPTASAVQKLTILAAGTFTLKFRGVDTTTLTAGPTGASTIATLESALEQLSSVGSVDISSAATTLAVTAEFQITFTAQPGALPLLVPDSNTIASVGEVQAGTTNFRKEIVVFSCTATKGTVKFTYKGEDDDTIKFDAKLADVEAELLAFIGVEADSISVSSVPAQTMLCSTANPADIIIVFHRVYGDISLGIAQGTTDSDAVITPNTAASIDGVYNDNPALTMSGTLQVGYQGLYTRPLNAESSADQLRYALENLDTIQTVDVARDRSYQALSGKVDVTEGEIFVTCSAGEMCNFYSAAYGLPGYFIRVGGDWYTVLTDGSSPGLHNTRLYLGDLSGRETGYKGSTQISVTVYEWTRGYVWTVDMLSVASPLGYLRAKVPRLYPADSVVQIYGSACTKCYYLPTQTTKKLTMGQQYNIEVYAYNFNGKGAAPGGGPITATPMQVPGPPSNVDLLVVSGHEIEVFISPPALATSNMSPDFNKDISSYIVQWDLDSTFKHGLSVCNGCVTSLTNFMLTVTTALTTLLPDGSKFTISELGCVLEVSQVLSTTVVQVDGHHTCDNFNSRSYSITYYTFPPEEIGGALIQGSPPFRYLISSLVVATKYFVRVAAVNSVPVQQIAPNGVPPDNRQWSTPLSVLTKDRAPDAPLSVALYPFAGTILQLQIQPSIRDGKGTQGAAISAFWIDVDTVSTFDSATKSAPIEVLATSALIPELYTGGPRIYYLTGLTTGTRYFAQVKVKNSIGYSRATLAPAPVAPIRHSDGPINAKVSTVTVSPNPIDSATVTWQRPAFNGGLGLTSYKIEWWCAQSRPEVQVVELKWKTTPTKAPFSLLFGGGESEDLDMDSSPENLRSALMNIAAGGILTIGHVEVSRTTLNSGLGYQWTITFDNVDLNAGNQRLLQMEIGTVVGSQDVSGNVYELTSGINVPALPTFPGKSEVQVLVTYHATTTVGGFFRLGYKGSAWTNYLPATISAANLKLALETLPTIGVVNVNLELMASAGNAFVIGQVWTITFISNVGNLPPLIVEPSKLTPADAFLGVKDGDNAVDGSGVLCLPGGDIACPGSWPVGIAGLRQQALPQKSVVELAVVGEAAVGYAFYETLDAATLTHTISPLIPGQAYFVAVTAKNALGLGIRAQTSPTSVIPPLQVPGPPTNVAVDVNPGVATQLVATWGAPTSDGGNPVRMYRIEYDPSPLFTNRGQQDAWCPVAPTTAVWRVQTKRTSADTTAPIGSGYFTLQLTRRNTPEPSEPIPWNAVATTREELGSAVVTNSKVFCTVASPTCTSKSVFPFGRLEKSGSMQSKLNYFASISAGVDVARSTVAATDGSYTWSITFLDTKDDFALAVKDVKLTCSDPLTCTMGTYDVLVAKVRSGVLPPSCVGSRIVPSIGALNKGQLYNLRVSAYNEVGFGKAGAAPNPQKPMVVPGPSTAVTLEVYSVSELVVLFSPPDDNGGDTVTAYELQWAIDSAFTIPSSVIVTIMSGVRAPYRRVISSLTKGTPYFVQIRARNSQGFGQFQLSSPTKMQPYTTPSAPTQVALGITSATMLTVRWAPPSDDGGDTISAYVVQWDVAAGFDSLALTMGTTVTVNDPAQRSYTITGLTPGTLYYVRVFAKNRGGQGTPQTSTPASLVPAVTDPGKPNTLTIETTLVTGELRISWLAPQIPAHGYPCAGTLQVPGSCPVVGATNMVFGGVDLKEYVVQYSEMSDFRIPTEQTTTALTVLLTGLDSSKTYYAQVYAVNSQGLKSAFCKRANTQSLLCPDQQVLLDSSVVTGDFVYAQPL